MKNNWLPIEKKVNDDLRQKYPDPLLQILANRGIKDDEKIKEFLNPDYDNQLHDPFLLKDIKKGVSRFLGALENREKILIFADYDADGLSAAAILSSFLDKVGFDNYEVYIPDRYNESYDLNEKQVLEFLQQDFNLLITVDCGIKAQQAVVRAQAGGLDVIITDHHLPGSKLPPAVAIVDPWQRGDKYPCKELSGAGVAFKFIQAVLHSKDFGLPMGWDKWLLDLVAIATVGDMVLLQGENRVLTHYGLLVLRKTKRIGLLTLFKSLGIRVGLLGTDDIGFSIAPRLNAASRLSHGRLAYELLTTSSTEEAKEIVKKLQLLNNNRKTAVDEVVNYATDYFSSTDLPAVLVIGKKDWNPGISGLAASRLVDKYTRPVFVWTENGRGEIKGSCRGTGEEDVVALMEQAGGKDFFIDLGGHYSAGGFSLLVDKLPELSSRLNCSLQTKDISSPVILYDQEIKLEDISSEFYNQLEYCAPFGCGNTRPVFLFRELIVDSFRFFGNGQVHLEIILKQGDKKIKAIKFFAGQKFKINSQQVVDIVATIEKNFFRSNGELRLKLLDIEL